MLFLHHYYDRSIGTRSDDTLPSYDGKTVCIPPGCCMVLVPCRSDHQTPSMTSCQLLTRTGVQVAKSTTRLIMYIIDNVTDLSLLLKHGDLLGAYYTDIHAGIKAEKCEMLTSQFEQMMDEQTERHWENIFFMVNDLANMLYLSPPSPDDLDH